jgi:hypothetical protein
VSAKPQRIALQSQFHKPGPYYAHPWFSPVTSVTTATPPASDHEA